ncbi:MAG TPA: OmpH family outer membrane protein [Vicinamibacterales bacterium]|nr:OmpH family outer membrane protein [Vicinamibacterales bacterium]
MRGFAIAAAAAFVVSASPVFAQAQAGQAPARPAAPTQAPAAPRPAQPAPAQAAPAQPVPAQPAVPPPQPVPFPAGAKVGFVNLQAIAQLSSDGKAAAARVNTLAQKKQTEAADKAKLLQSNQQKLETSGGVMSDAARAQLQKDIERQTVEGQRFEQDAQAELNELQQQLQQEFQSKLMPVLEALSKEKGLQVLFSAGDSGVIWAEPGIDLTLEAVARLDKKPAGK